MLSKLAYLTLCRSIQLLTTLARGAAAKTWSAAPPDPTSPARAHRPRAAGRDQSSPTPSPPVLLLRPPGDAAGLAPAPRRGRVDLPPYWPGATARPSRPAADHPPGHREPSPGYQRIQGEWCTWACGSRQPRSAPRCTATGWIRRRGRPPPPGERSSASRPRGSWRVTSSRSIPPRCGAVGAAAPPGPG